MLDIMGYFNKIILYSLRTDLYSSRTTEQLGSYDWVPLGATGTSGQKKIKRHFLL